MSGWNVVCVGVIAACMVGHAAAGEDAVEILQETGNAFAQISEEVLPAVVFVDVESTVEVPGRRYRHPLEEFFGHPPFRGNGAPGQGESRKYHQQGQGSGFIISQDGYILTNHHVVDGADRITVTLGDGRRFKASLVGTDPKSEVGLIKISDESDLPFIPLGDSDALRVGEWVLAAGNPFGLSQTLTAGIVSAKDRKTGMLGADGYENFIQTDAAINPGNSGGPLINIQGEVVGINTAIYSRTGGYMGIGFAIPINQAARIKDQLIEFGRVSRSVLGIIIQEVDEDLARQFGREESGGVLVSQVLPDSAAQEAGLQAGDIVVELNGRKVIKVGSFRNRIASTPPHTEIELKVFRSGDYTKITAVTKELGGEDQVSMRSSETSAFEQIGLRIEDLSGPNAKQLGLEVEEGVLVTEVEQGSTAWRAGLKPGQVITSINREPITNQADFYDALEAHASSGQLLLLVTDGRSSRFVVVRLDE